MAFRTREPTGRAYRKKCDTAHACDCQPNGSIELRSEQDRGQSLWNYNQHKAGCKFEHGCCGEKVLHVSGN